MPQTCRSCQESVEEGMRFCPSCGLDLAEGGEDKAIEWPTRMPERLQSLPEQPRLQIFGPVLGALIVWTLLLTVVGIMATFIYMGMTP